ncbi:MAG: hypothetical protein KC636_05735 [Myxococcales bacterium]|nr:hypothetical protein [Myxococcales bacterium]
MIGSAHRRALGGVALALALGGLACKSARIRGPEELRDRYLAALKSNDPDAAYALLAPEVQARTTPAEFRARWQAQKKEREAAIAAINKLDDAHKAPVRSGTTVHRGGHVITWAEVEGRYRIVDGLPGLPNTTTPAAAIRSLIAAVRSADIGGLLALMDGDLVDQLRDEWQRRVDVLEERLEQPGSVEYTPDMQRAFFRYEPGRGLTLEQTAGGWRIKALQ